MIVPETVIDGATTADLSQIPDWAQDYVEGFSRNADGTYAVRISPEAERNRPKTSKADIWRRLTDAEAETIDTLLGNPPQEMVDSFGISAVKLRRIWDDAAVLNHDNPMYPALKAKFVEIFGQDRADTIMAPSNLI